MLHQLTFVAPMLIELWELCPCQVEFPVSPVLNFILNFSNLPESKNFHLVLLSPGFLLGVTFSFLPIPFWN